MDLLFLVYCTVKEKLKWICTVPVQKQSEAAMPKIYSYFQPIWAKSTSRLTKTEPFSFVPQLQPEWSQIFPRPSNTSPDTPWPPEKGQSRQLQEQRPLLRARLIPALMWLTSAELRLLPGSHFPGAIDYPDKRLLTAGTSPKGSVLLWEPALQREAAMGVPGWKWGTRFSINVSIFLRHNRRAWAGEWKIESASVWGFSWSRDKTEANCEIWRHFQISPVSKWALRSVRRVTSTGSLHGSLVLFTSSFVPSFHSTHPSLYILKE